MSVNTSYIANQSPQLVPPYNILSMISALARLQQLYDTSTWIQVVFMKERRQNIVFFCY